MLPRVVLHNAVSLDGRISGFEPDLVQFYEIASRWKEDATLAGADTLLSSTGDVLSEDETAFQPPGKATEDTRPILAVPDSRGRVRIWHFLKTLPYWRDYVALCSHSTPGEYLDYLERRRIDCIVTGNDHVDLRSALEELNAQYGVKVIRVDSGGTLNGILLRLGLVDEVSILIYPSLVGGPIQRSVFHAPDLNSSDGAIKLKQTHIEQLEGDVTWLRYEVIK